MRGSSSPQRRPTVGREDHQHAPPIRVENPALDQVVAFEPVNEPRRSTPADEEVSGKIPHPHRPARLVELNQGVIPGEREVTFIGQFLLKGAHRARISLKKTTPGQVMRISHDGTINQISLARDEIRGI